MFVWCAAILAATVAVMGSHVDRQNRATAPAVRDDFGHLAEGFTAVSREDGIEAGYRMFSAPDFQTLCDRAEASAVTRLEPGSSSVRMQVGSPFEYRDLKIVAYDAAGSLRPKVPIAIESERGSSVVDVRSDHIAGASVTPIREGTVRFRIRTICDGPVAETFVTAQAVPR